MKFRFFLFLSVMVLLVGTVLYFPSCQVGAAGNGLTVVGLYSETSAGTVGYRVGTANWTPVKVGDKIPDNAEINVTIDRDWVELCPANNPNAVYEINGAKGPVTKKVTDLMKEKAKAVSFPLTGKADPKFANKVVVKQYLGRQMYQTKKGEEWVDIKYGDVLSADGSVKIIGINNTIILVLPDGKENKVIGPIKFAVKDVLKGGNLYKYMNVTK